tara:strand:+ start:107 stop:4453 length:4347 start_codon:yes stop_codon:yes gene_type:complete
MGMKKEHQELVNKYTLGNPMLKSRIEARVDKLMESKGLYRGGVINAAEGVSVDGTDNTTYDPFSSDDTAQTATDAQKEFDDYIKKMTEEKGFVGGGDGGDYLVEDNNLYSQKQKDAFGIGNPMLDLFGDQFDKYIELKNAAGSAQGSKTETSSVDQAQEALTTNRNAIITLGEIKYPPAEGERDTRTATEISNYNQFQTLQKDQLGLVDQLSVAQQNLSTSGVPSGTEVTSLMASDPSSFVPEQDVAKIGDQSAADLASQTVDSGLAKSTNLDKQKLIDASGQSNLVWKENTQKFHMQGTDRSYTAKQVADMNNLDLNSFYSGTDAGESRGITSGTVDDPTPTASVGYTAKTTINDVKETLDGVSREYKAVPFAEAGFTPPPSGAPVTQAIEAFHNPTTGEKVIVNTGGYTAPDGWIKGNPEGLFEKDGLSAAQKDALSKSVIGQEGPKKQKVDENNNPVLDAEGNPVMELDPAQLALIAAQIDEVTTVAITNDLGELTEDQKVKAATLANSGLDLPSAIAQVIAEDKTFNIEAAKLPKRPKLDEDGNPVLDEDGNEVMEVYTPEAGAATEYDLGDSESAKRIVDEKKELAAAQGLGLDPEQSNDIVSDYTSDLEAAQGKVREGETIDPEDTYSLNPTDVSKLIVPKVADPATDVDFPKTEGAETEYRSNIDAIQGDVGKKELVNADDIGVNKEVVNGAVYTTAKIMEELNDNAVMKAENLEQTTLAIATEGVVKATSTVRGQMEIIMQEFNDGTPAWAAGAMRAATALMNSRGLGASSMAGAAIAQAALESALPIAEVDAAFFQRIQLDNLTDKRAVALANAAAVQGIELQSLDNRQAAALQNSTNAFELQSQNLSNLQEVVLANYSTKAALSGKTLDINAQVSITNAARYAEMKDINLNASQQTLLQESSENLQIELSELSNDQQSAVAALQIKAAMKGQNLTNEQQMAVIESNNNFTAAEFDASAKTAAFMQDAQARAALEGKSMDIRQQTALFNAARIAEVNDTNLTNEQQVNLQKSTEALTIEVENLNSREATALANAQLRAALQGKVLDNKQQVEILNTERYASANDITVTNKQQAFVQEYASRTTMEGKVIDNKQQAEIFNVANEIQERGLTLETEQSTLIYNMTNNLTVETANLSSKTQTALANAQIDAALTGQELSNSQQEAVINNARISEIANLNFTKDQSEAIQNSKLAQTASLANLSNEQALIMSDAAALSNLELAGLDNRQQAEVQNANNFLQLDLANLDNEQQTAIFKAQQQVSALFTDAAAENAALNFNAASENQTNQFFADLALNANKFTLEQQNLIKSLDLTEENANKKFNESLKSAREQFETSNAIIIEQANTKWRQDIVTIDTAEQNDANASAVEIAVGITSAVIDQIWQKERDDMDYAFTASESGLDRVTQILVAKMQGEADLDAAQLKIDFQNDRDVAQGLFDWLFG